MTNILEIFGNQEFSSALYLFLALDISHDLKNSLFISKFILGKLIYCSQKLNSCDENRCVGRNAFFAAGVAEPFGCCRFNRHVGGFGAEAFGEGCCHRGDVWIDFRTFGTDGDVGVAESVSGIFDEFDDVAKQDFAVDAFVARVAVGKVKADVAEVCRAEKSVAECVDDHVGIAVTEQSEAVVDFYAAEPQLSTFNESMHVEAHSYAYVYR